MLFSTYTFLLLFLPLTLAGFFLLGRIHWRWSTSWLTACSLLFYAWWKPEANQPWTPWFLLLVICSCAANDLCGWEASILHPVLPRWRETSTQRVLAGLFDANADCHEKQIEKTSEVFAMAVRVPRSLVD
jgi:hypothetical protein